MINPPDKSESQNQANENPVDSKFTRDALAGDTARAATTDEVKDLRRQARDLKEVVAEQTLELRLLKKNMIGDGGDQE